ncbi:hypothetical protein GPECTOR_8g64 [Gonium pectorale]|uniref:Fido domain-containing protein n=1 Tax=Gonium pectorale TaxID=33097 RepID=A0A150GTD3_GONPE|nr:hypothetical protein GPECTOR_8g64 [Gonium pectorale]|eukprot:KXZ53071.1 hypothetical protein GPECTOR_8g64 [Gonium pectorale]
MDLARKAVDGSSPDTGRRTLLAPADGGKPRRELLQHAAAFAFLHKRVVLEKEKLSPDVVLDAHKLLLSGLTGEDGLAVPAGQYRTTRAFAGSYLFPPPEAVEGALKRLLEAYEQRASSPEEDPFALAAWLSYVFVSIHPFDDGNGRMGRLLLNMALLSRGVPFCSALGFSCGQSKAKRHYLQCLKKGRPSELAFTVLCSIRITLANFFEDLRTTYPAVELAAESTA